MKKIVAIMLVGIIVVFTMSSNSYALRFSGGPKYADPKLAGINPLKHMPGIVKLTYVGSTTKGNRVSQIFFKISFDQKVKHFDAFWAKKGDDVSENRSEIKVKNNGVVNGLYEYDVTFNAGSIKDSVDSVDFFIGCYGPASGYPNLRDVSINLNPKKGSSPVHFNS